MRLQTIAFSLLLFVCVVASGCAGQNSSNLEKITENPEDYVGKEVTLRGQIQIKKDESVINRKAAESTVDSETIGAKNAERKIGDLEGEIPIVGECEQSDYASEVKVKGAIKNYSTCNCEVNQSTIRENGESMYLVLHEEKGLVKTYNRSKVTDMAGYPTGENKLVKITGSNFDRINGAVNVDLKEKLGLSSLDSDETLPSAHYWDNGTRANEKYLPAGVGSAGLENYKYSLSEESVIIQSDEVDEDILNETVLSATCESDVSVNVSKNYNEYSKVEFNGCKNPTRKQYYFACESVIEQYK